MPRTLDQHSMPRRDVAAYRAELEAEGFAESNEGNLMTVYRHPDGREVQLEDHPRRKRLVLVTSSAPCRDDLDSQERIRLSKIWASATGCN